MGRTKPETFFCSILLGDSSFFLLVGEALRRISEGAAMIRTKGEAGTGNVVEAVRHARNVNAEIRRVSNMTDEELYVYAKE